VPVTAVLSRRDLYIRADPGSPLGHTEGLRVTYDVDSSDDDTAYSVVVTGTAVRFERRADDAAEGPPLTPPDPAIAHDWMRIRPLSVNGRAFRVVPAPGSGSPTTGRRVG
jgi:hypothetical protein